jgi:hypothetical protein
MATHLGASTTNAEGTHRGHQACQVVPRPLDSLPTHTGVERKLPRSHGLQGCYPRSTARTSPPSKVYTRCTDSTVHGHIRRSHAPPSACTATVAGLPLPDPTTIARSNRLAPQGGRGKGGQPRPLSLPGCPHGLPRSACHAASTNQLPPSAITASTTTRSGRETREEGAAEA